MSERWTVLRVLQWTTERFTREGLDSPRLDAEVLLAAALGMERIRLYVDYAKPLSSEELAPFRALVRRRLAGEPVAYVLGRKEFWSLELAVGPAVLVPRPDTELLVELGLAELKRLAGSEHDRATTPRVVDVGTGSGAVALALSRERPDARVIAVDISPQALAVARANAVRHDLRVRFLRANLLAPFAPASLDLVVSNPPYIPHAEVAALPREIREHEPRLALDGGPDGLVLIRRLITQAARCLRPGAALYFELASPQAAAAAQLCRAAGLIDVAIHRDLAGADRVVTGRRRWS